jgi:hypothetical protein
LSHGGDADVVGNPVAGDSIMDAAVERLLASLPAAQRADAETLSGLMSEATGSAGRIGYEKIVGFGHYHYRYGSGREGDSSPAGFAMTSRGITIYLISGFRGYDDLLGQLGKHTKTKYCLYVRRLADVDLDVLRRLIQRSVRHVAATERALGAVPRLSEMPPWDAVG